MCVVLDYSSTVHRMLFHAEAGKMSGMAVGPASSASHSSVWCVGIYVASSIVLLHFRDYVIFVALCISVASSVWCLGYRRNIPDRALPKSH